MVHVDKFDLLLVVARIGSHLLGLFLKPDIFCSPGSLDHNFKLKFKEFLFMPKAAQST